jgi:TatD DNase family protein
MLIDIHAHLDELDDPGSALRESREKGVSAVVAASMGLSSCRRNLEIFERQADNPGASRVYLALGVHPSGIKPEEIPAAFDFIGEHLEKAVAVGEVGLDFWDKDAKKEEKVRARQKEVFEKMIGIALKYKKPLIVHSRGSWRECFEMLKGNSVREAVFHWYSGPLDVLKNVLDAGYYISVTPALEYSKDLKAAAAAAPIERIMIETDTPVYGWKPVDITKSAEYLSVIKGSSVEEIARVTTENATRFFGNVEMGSGLDF